MKLLRTPSGRGHVVTLTHALRFASIVSEGDGGAKHGQRKYSPPVPGAPNTASPTTATATSTLSVPPPPVATNTYIHSLGASYRRFRKASESAEVSKSATLQEIRPGNTDLSPITTPTSPNKFSFHNAEANRMALVDAQSNCVVPNNDAKPKLPMWSSSLTSPKLSLQRIRPENWICGTLDFVEDEKIERFVAWVKERADAAERKAFGDHADNKQSYLSYALDHHVKLKMRAGYSIRGVFARRDFQAGDVILATPAAVGSSHCAPAGDSDKGHDAAAAATPLWGLHLNSETLQAYSAAAKARRPPSYDSIRTIASHRTSRFDPHPHPLFVDQLHFACLLACEKEAGAESSLKPYIDLLPDPIIDDEWVKELHKGIVDPATHLEYRDHQGKFDVYVWKILQAWGEHAPSEASFRWALRLVLARQLILPSFRKGSDVDLLANVCTEEKRREHEEEFWMRHVTRVHMWLLTNVLGVVDKTKATVNDFDPSSIATVSPILDMLHHCPRGGNVRWEVEAPLSSSRDDGSSDENGEGHGEGAHYRSRGAVGDGTEELLLIATRPIRRGEELLRTFTRCYSVSYTMYRFGFLPLRDREMDLKADLLESGVDPKLVGGVIGREELLGDEGRRVRRVKAAGDKRLRLPMAESN